MGRALICAVAPVKQEEESSSSSSLSSSPTMKQSSGTSSSVDPLNVLVTGSTKGQHTWCHFCLSGPGLGFVLAFLTLLSLIKREVHRETSICSTDMCGFRYFLENDFHSGSSCGCGNCRSGVSACQRISSVWGQRRHLLKIRQVPCCFSYEDLVRVSRIKTLSYLCFRY